MYFTLGEGMEYLKYIIGHNTIVSFMDFNYVFFRSFWSFQVLS